MADEGKIKELLGSVPTAVVIQLLIAVFTLGGIWAEFKEMHADQEAIKEDIEEIEKNKASTTDLEVVNNRLSKKIAVQKELDKRLRKIECK